jgi:hypothetical protein
MATNITEKDKVLYAVIDWCKKNRTLRKEEMDEHYSDERKDDFCFFHGQAFALDDVIAFCRSITSHPVTLYSPEQLEHERRKAWQEGYAAGWKDQECDFPPHTSENPYKETIE